MITSDSPDRPYSTRLRTALVLIGTGTAGAYHAGVLRALHEAGVRIDLVAGRGIGAVGAMFAAVDGGQRLWDRDGLWKQPAIGRALLNKEEGDDIVVTRPDGTERCFELVKLVTIHDT